MKYKDNRFQAGFLCLLAVTVLFFFSGPAPCSAVTLSDGQSVYVPIYSHIYHGDKEKSFNLTATLSIRNTDPKQEITLLSVDYYGSDGVFLKGYLSGKVMLKQLASTRYIIQRRDKTGGSGANFIVRWTSDKPVNPPVIEAIMIGTQSQQGISFTSRGQVIQED